MSLYRINRNLGGQKDHGILIAVGFVSAAPQPPGAAPEAAGEGQTHTNTNTYYFINMIFCISLSCTFSEQLRHGMGELCNNFRVTYVCFVSFMQKQLMV